ncbi:DUF2905 domain-containing protein [Synergistaceae bacterium OttesenSCG-928-D05]|nr:DUF2905 domain-containing protein [Synergistaceae bacterium OttesenSCG-928-D05]
MGKTLIVMGLLLAAVGAFLLFAGKLDLPFGKLPGDITYQKKNFTVFAPFGSMLLISIVITLILNIFSRWK